MQQQNLDISSMHVKRRREEFPDPPPPPAPKTPTTLRFLIFFLQFPSLIESVSPKEEEGGREAKITFCLLALLPSLSFLSSLFCFSFVFRPLFSFVLGRFPRLFSHFPSHFLPPRCSKTWLGKWQPICTYVVQGLLGGGETAGAQKKARSVIKNSPI